MKLNARQICAMKLMETVTGLLKMMTVMMRFLALMIIVMKLWANASMFIMTRTAMTTTHALGTIVIHFMDATMSMKIVTMIFLAPMTGVMRAQETAIMIQKIVLVMMKLVAQ